MSRLSVCLASGVAACFLLGAAWGMPSAKKPLTHKAKLRTAASVLPIAASQPSSSNSPFDGLNADRTAQVLRFMRDESDSHSQSENGLTLLKSGNVAGAIVAFRKALDLNPNNYQADYGLARCADMQGDTAGMLDYYRAAIYTNLSPPSLQRIRETDVSRLMECALALDQSGQTAEAVAVYDRAASLLNYEDAATTGKPFLEALLPDFGDGPGQAPYSPQGLGAMARLAIGIDTFSHAGYGDPEPLTNFQQALALAPDSAAANYYLGHYLYGKNDPGAKALLERAVQLGDERTAAAAKKVLGYLH